MPPRGHSSSHHSSSHHSSHSSSHHSSSSSSSSSSRSHSSHSSSHHSSSARSSYRSSTPVHRKRTSQPYGWDNAQHGAVGHFYGAAHDYDYYPQGWTAPDGQYFKEGYYDENGQHYDNMIMAGSETMLKCDYCGSRMVYKWKEGELPVCDKCGATLQIDITDKKKAAYSGNASRRNGSAGKIAIGVFSCALAMTFLAAMLVMFTGVGSRSSSGSARYETVSAKNSIYVDEIGRTCYLDGEDWYDSQTECWFYYNGSAAPAQWQYWYEGISSDYGDYGWMEYDMGEETWYIETDNGNWVHLPAGYDTSRLWHMTDEYINAYE